MSSIFAKISSRENISNSLFAKFSSRENKVLYSIRNLLQSTDRLAGACRRGSANGLLAALKDSSLALFDDTLLRIAASVDCS